MTNHLFQLLQICDSNFPSGAFSHSFGLETYIQEGKVVDKKTFLVALKQFLQTQFVFTDGLACRLAFEYLQDNRLDSIWQLDHELFALAMAKETREGNRRIGRQMVKVMNELFPNKQLKTYQIKIKEKEAHGHSSIVFAFVCQGLDIEVETTLSTYLFATTTTLVQNAVRGIPIGQTDGQKILVEIQPFLNQIVKQIMSLDEEQLGAGAPGLEIAQMLHEQLSVRLFMS
ncbi:MULTISPECIES: urease accessory protein UreF [Bacillaceae]|uniref:urease accessory protein UreF n=1 Tax=Bacillaceae TaxID=186817 RepID=UPI000BFE20DD|nr:MULTISPECIES: urease accessory protein UreF [Bacillaceae]PGT87689.1 urease accessory protein UreF [Bacillus sp. AFS040349]UGB29389.1 urease accessory protein UreF [Metabacillus sp. B2-18]